MAAAHPPDYLAPIAAAFRPSPAELINQYLVPKIAAAQQQQEMIVPDFMNEANVYSKPPHQLVTEHAPAPGTGSEWYFFTRLRYIGGNQRRWSRTVGGNCVVGRWHPETKREVSGTVGGYVKKLCYQHKKECGEWGKSSGWLMSEYGYTSSDGRASDIVLCKVYRSPAAHHQEHQGTTTMQETVTRFLMADDDGGVEIPHAEDSDAFFWGYLLGEGNNVP